MGPLFTLGTKRLERLGWLTSRQEEVDRGGTNATPSCPDIWELDNGDIAVIGRDMTEQYAGRLPTGVSVVSDERLVVIPRNMIIAAKPDIPDA